MNNINLGLSVKRVLIGPLKDTTNEKIKMVNREFAVEKLCIIDSFNMRVIDIEDKTYYDIARIINGKIVASDIDLSLGRGRRYAYVHAINLKEDFSMFNLKDLQLPYKTFKIVLEEAMMAIKQDELMDGNLVCSNIEFVKSNKKRNQKTKRR